MVNVYPKGTQFQMGVFSLPQMSTLSLKGQRHTLTLGAMPLPPPLNFYFLKILVYVLILAILLYKIIFFPLNNIIHSFQSNDISTNFFYNIGSYLCPPFISLFYLLKITHHICSLLKRKKLQLQLSPPFKGHKKILGLKSKQNIQSQKSQPNNKNYQQ